VKPLFDSYDDLPFEEGVGTFPGAILAEIGGVNGVDCGEGAESDGLARIVKPLLDWKDAGEADGEAQVRPVWGDQVALDCGTT
jgi:hypothetical protein